MLGLLGWPNSAPPGEGGGWSQVKFELRPSADAEEPVELQVTEEFVPELLLPEVDPLENLELVEHEYEYEFEELPSFEEPPLEPIDDFGVDLAAVRWRPRAAPQPTEVAAPAPAQAEAGGESEASLVEHAPPEYPLLSRQRREEGTVELEFDLDEQGRVLDVRVTRSSGHARLDRAAQRAARSWRFEPARRLGQAIPSTWRQRVTFRLAA